MYAQGRGIETRMDHFASNYNNWSSLEVRGLATMSLSAAKQEKSFRNYSNFSIW